MSGILILLLRMIRAVFVSTVRYIVIGLLPTFRRKGKYYFFFFQEVARKREVLFVNLIF